MSVKRKRERSEDSPSSSSAVNDIENVSVSESTHPSEEAEGSSLTTDGTGGLKIELELSEGLDPFNVGNTTLVDLRVNPSTTLQDIHNRVMASLDVDVRQKRFVYTLHGSDDSLNMERTMEVMGVDENKGLHIVCKPEKQASAPNTPSYRKKEKRKTVAGYPIEVICATRIGLRVMGMRRFKVVVNPMDRVNDMMREMSDLLVRSGLKFKCGRTVLKEDRTFRDLGVEHGDEIVITGGRS